jgi:Ni,Fe-hydrogenase I cytochrome b subunit
LFNADSIHLFVQWLIYCYIAMHISGVVYADLNQNKGIVSGMISGGTE